MNLKKNSLLIRAAMECERNSAARIPKKGRVCTKVLAIDVAKCESVDDNIDKPDLNPNANDPNSNAPVAVAAAKDD